MKIVETWSPPVPYKSFTHTWTPTRISEVSTCGSPLWHTQGIFPPHSWHNLRSWRWCGQNIPKTCLRWSEKDFTEETWSINLHLETKCFFQDHEKQSSVDGVRFHPSCYLFHTPLGKKNDTTGIWTTPDTWRLNGGADSRLSIYQSYHQKQVDTCRFCHWNHDWGGDLWVAQDALIFGLFSFRDRSDIMFCSEFLQD